MCTCFEFECETAKVQDLSSDCCRFADVPCTQNMDQLPFYCSIETVTTESPPTRTQRLGSAAEPPCKWSRYFPCKQIFSAIAKAAVRAGARYGQARGRAAKMVCYCPVNVENKRH